MNSQLIEYMLLSEDEEVRKVAFDYIKINYNVNFKVYLDLSNYKYSLSEESSVYFAHMEHILYSIIEKTVFQYFIYKML